MTTDNDELVSFVQHFLPGLDAGGYQLEVQQQIPDVPQNAASYSSTYTFAVTADRFSLTQPGQTVNSVFPADNASGEFSTVLPHVVFSQPTFPWVRFPGTTLPYARPPTGSDTDADVPTWLWVMILDEDDVARCAKAGLTLNLAPAAGTVADLFEQQALPVGVTSTLGANLSYFRGATDTSGLEEGESLGDPVRTIDVPLFLFRELAPSYADLKQMAHGRIVSLVDQPTVDGVQPPGAPTGSFGIVFGNRLPQKSRKTYACLVSLEGVLGDLPPEPVRLDIAVRLAVLTSWSFYSTGEPASFVHQLERLNGRTPRGPPAACTSLCVPYAGSNPVVQGALNMGYVPLDEMLRTAERTVSWYRCPLLPCAPPALDLPIPIPSPDSAMIFDPTTGMLDVSYAAAWTLGRQLALQDKAFSVAYYNWLRGLEQQVNQMIEGEMIQASFGRVAAPGDGAATARAPGASLLKRAILLLDREQTR